MLNKSVCLFFFLNLSYCLSAQEISLYANYLNNNLYNINPAAAGFNGAFISQLTVSKKWIGINGSPTSELISNSVKLGEEEFYDHDMFLNRPLINLTPRVGLGLSVFNESSGPLRHTGVLFAYAYHIPLRNHRLSFGLSGAVSQYHLNTQEFKPVTSDDPSLYTNTSAIIPAVNFGILYYSRELFAGISANDLVNFNNVMDHTKTFPDIVACGGYKFTIDPNYKFEPSLFFWKYGQKNFAIDINCKLYFHDKNWLLLSYQGFNEILAGFGLNIKKGIQLYYTYAVSTTGLASYNAGNQSISVRADMTALVRK
jgi:type IX secretion system PorP/SprF family membrane protein